MRFKDFDTTEVHDSMLDAKQRKKCLRKYLLFCFHLKNMEDSNLFCFFDPISVRFSKPVHLSGEGKEIAAKHTELLSLDAVRCSICKDKGQSKVHCLV